MEENPFLAQDDKGWGIAVSSSDNYTPVCLANGRLGFTFTADPFKIQSVLCNGVYDKDGERSVPRILETVGFAGLEFLFDEKPIDPAHVLDWKQILDMKEASLTTFFAVKQKARFTCTAYALRQLPYCGLLHVSIVPDEDAILTVRNHMTVPETVKNESFTFETRVDGELRIPLQQTIAKSKSGRFDLATTAIYLFDHEKPSMFGCGTSEHDEYFKMVLTAGKPFSFFLAGAVCTSADFPDPKHESERFCLAMLFRGTRGLLDDHHRAWKDLWRHDIVITGDPEAQRNIRFALFNLFSSIRHDTALSIPPMGLTSQEYNGHIFWDAELWMFPVLLAFDSGLARNLLDYRYNLLDQAKKRARNYGYKGAMFPWESAGSGEETTPTWALTGLFEQHITADIAIACWQYFRVTRDMRWLQERGFPVIQAAAEFWLSRVTKNRDGSYSINGVIGPDEYTNPVNDSAFTNAAAATALRFATLAAAALGETADPQWNLVAGKLVIPHAADGTTLEYLGYPSQGETIKQADANLLAYPLSYYSDEKQIRQDLEFYEMRISDKGPAMSHSVLALIYARLEDAENAWRLFEKGHKPNLLPPFGAFADKAGGKKTYFTTGAGGMLQAVLFGFAGLSITDAGLVRNKPCLPKHWNRLVIKGVGTDQCDIDSDTPVLPSCPIAGAADSLEKMEQSETQDILPAKVKKTRPEKSIKTTDGTRKKKS